jgi:hypothetical protein
MSRYSIKVAAAAGALTLLVASGGTFAADCKGLEKPRCESNDSCSWVDTYKRKDGIQVAGHCRKKGGKKSSASSG